MSKGVAIAENMGIILDPQVWPEIFVAATYRLTLNGVRERRAANAELFWRVWNV